MMNDRDSDRCCSSVVEHILGKDEVMGSSPISSFFSDRPIASDDTFRNNLRFGWPPWSDPSPFFHTDRLAVPVIGWWGVSASR
jgi:hypothetical protein